MMDELESVEIDDDARIKPSKVGLTRRRLARLVAVQALYQLEMTREGGQVIYEELTTLRIRDLLSTVGLEVDPDDVDRDWLKVIITRIMTDVRERDDVLKQNLSADWSFERIGFLLRAILRAGTFEIADRKDVPVGVIVNEYVEVSRLFLENRDADFVNAMLRKMAEHFRASVATENTDP